MITAPLIFYIFIWSRGSKQKGKRGKEDVEEGKKEVPIDEIDKEKVDIGEERKTGKRSLLDKSKGKKRCDPCGTELVYKENMESYYFPECHEYK